MSHWNGKTVVVTGGTAGLGKAIADEFLVRGANVVAISRSCEESHDTPQNLTLIQADVCDDKSVDAAIQSIVAKMGSIDVWINNVGKSTRAAFESCSVEDYIALMEINFYSALRCSLAVLPELKKTSGSIVQIGSLAAKTGWKNVAPYVVGKHALAGFAHQLRLEGPDNVHSLFVCPGPIQREDSQSRYADQAKGLEPSASSPGAGVKISGTAPTKIAKLILKAIENRKVEVVIPAKARLLFSILQMSPQLGDWLLRKFAK